ncbi:BQ2448_3657 [Microbotryum intermedium]|uniref:COX assembly mitochondrial protein n=1 Tax=Microbotryum intermedium TaxID=269621 RepID=A0A238FCH1_9BASI|nr:BQ2448_3657 [Microbotryum intermedium]
MSSPSPSSSTATPTPATTPHQQYALSRNEEAKVLAQCKIDALRHCEVEAATFSECADGRTVSVAWKCRKQFRAMQAMTEEKQDQAKLRYLQDRRGGIALP